MSRLDPAHQRVFPPRCLARDNVACDVDKVLWPDHKEVVLRQNESHIDFDFTLLNPYLRRWKSNVRCH
ncbi:hypothetical protein N1851_001766 [Merluccius polli]|uniref:Uncharacterized protein n=1 Tax=Merluccius polli TaxID=89951 RepID=A0AA47P969_MERPO|nr:hypothetical protein N1851_001766 [Merluccius polli]